MPPLNVVPDAAPVPLLLKVSAAVVLAVTVPDPPSATAVPFTVTELLAKALLGIALSRALLSVPVSMLLAERLNKGRPLPTKLDPVTVPPTDANPAVRMLPPVTLPVTARAPKVPTEVILVCAAVVKVPTMLVPDKLPPAMLPVALT